MKGVTLVLGIRGPHPLTEMRVAVKGNLMLLPVYLVSGIRLESLQYPNDKAMGIYGKKAVEQLKEFVIAKVVGYGSQYAVTVWKSSTCCGSETIPAIAALEEYYNADAEKGLIAATIPATGHSVMCAGGKDDGFETFKRLITEVYPSGYVSIVSDTWDYWKVMTDCLPGLKDGILARDGRAVIRPDSGNPVHIVCGYEPDGFSHFQLVSD